MNGSERQSTSSRYTNPHVHADDAVGAIFYAATPAEGATLCYDGGQGTAARARWAALDPAMVRAIPGRRHVSARPGDLLLAPLGWLRHWVPPLDAAGAAARTVVVLNAACL